MKYLFQIVFFAGISTFLISCINQEDEFIESLTHEHIAINDEHLLTGEQLENLNELQETILNLFIEREGKTLAKEFISEPLIESLLNQRNMNKNKEEIIEEKGSHLNNLSTEAIGNMTIESVDIYDIDIFYDSGEDEQIQIENIFVQYVFNFESDHTKEFELALDFVDEEYKFRDLYLIELE
ncbi:hypothetical protein [Alkalibacillus aidingensis]|uniref:hypothetical protein n=1 Tax=Alkalibacillus aidingensis TaxID=2747607 RepID=UPI0016600FD5|nr:hypothetical protein [Alkalibacillus aidingensis]